MLVRVLTEASSGVEVVGEAGSGEEAVELVVELRPDVVIMDLGLPKMTGTETTERLALLAPASRVLIRAGGADDRVAEAIVAGASGYVLKSASTGALIAAVTATAEGQAVLSPQIAGKLLHRISDVDHNVVRPQPTMASTIRDLLTERELEIFTLLASGDTNSRIASNLSLSANTVANHITSILTKLHLQNRIQAAVHAVRAGIA
ncbi:MAG: response regulator transcription factor [Solirubrobacteraceae bacterium]